MRQPTTRTSPRALRVVAWLFNPVPFFHAVLRDYRREFQLAAAIFVASTGTGFLVSPHLGSGGSGRDRDTESRLNGITRIAETIDDALEGRGVEKSANDEKLKEVVAALVDGDSEEANRLMAAVDLEELLAPRPPRLSRVLTLAWTLSLLAVVLDTFLLVVLGFILGIYPVGRTIVAGVLLGSSLSRFASGEEAGELGASSWLLPVWLVFAIASLLSAAIGLDMARYIVQSNQGTWFKSHIRRGLKTWGTSVLPALVAAMLLLAVAFVVLVVATGDPVVR